MAKNLQSVLNSVVNDLLQEASPAAAAVNNALYNSNDMANAVKAVAQKAAEDDWNAKIAGNMVQAGIDTREDSFPQSGSSDTPITNARLRTIAAYNDSLSPWGKAQLYAGKFGDWAGDQYAAMKQSMADHPYYWGAGGLGAALAAGAGALYLRKRQREANRGA